ncbi:uncharacterized protein LOC117192928 [Drosophila miranda]|uniref:uncharacterized protein LOC117192928 n=1 Tax=Drosophila miranda TaxID=7229 RepID=UPI00143F7F33|nr:uncharacterized protein LOC117192928 [Drosophila miranda]
MASAAAASSVCASCGAGAGSHRILHIYSAWALITLLAASAAIVQSAAVSFGDLLSHPTFKPLCSAQQEHFIESDGKESSLKIELKPGTYGAEHPSCSRILSAPPNYGFIVRLILPKLRHTQPDGGAPSSSIMPAASSTARPRRTPNTGGLTEISASTPMDRLNTTKAMTTPRVGRTCPLNIVSKRTRVPTPAITHPPFRGD